MINEWNLTQTNLSRLSQKKPEVAVLGACAVEPHNFHLPEGQDLLHTSYIVNEVTRMAWEETGLTICLPSIPFGVDCNLLDYPLAIHVSQATLDRMITEITESLLHHEIRKILLINGHGGNDFGPLVRQIQYDLDVFFFLCNWYTVGLDKYHEIFEKADDHAGEMETSVALELHPELVEMDKAGKGQTRPFRFEALRKGWVGTSRDFSKINDQCATSDPLLATSEKGRRYLDIVCQRISTFLIELAKTPIDEFFPHEPGFLSQESERKS